MNAPLYEGQTLAVTLGDGGVAELCFDNQADSVNKFNQQTVKELADALQALKSAANVKGLLVTSGKSVFIVGADIMELSQLDADGLSAVSKQNNANFSALEDLPFPTLVAINGFALGGGFEFSLGCDFRVMSTEAQVGLPETKLGIIPGWGGTVRLPRLIGFDNAVEWIASGSHKRPPQALKDGAVDAVLAPEQLRDEALKMLQRAIDGELDYHGRRKRKTSRLQLNAVELQLAATTCRALVAAKAGKHYPAPLLAVDLMTKAASLDRDGALVEESKAFGKIGTTPQCRAMIGLFLNDQYLGKVAKKLAKGVDKPVTSAGVLGAGIMGGGISYQHALKGVPVVMKDIAQPALDLGLSEANKLVNKRVAKGRLTPLKAGEILSRINPTLHDVELSGVDLVVEAVVENPKVKKQVLADVEQVIGSDAILASNTSTISITGLAEGLQRPEQFCGMHFFNPVHAMPLVEIIRGEKTADTTVAKAVSHALALGKKPVVVNDCPGFLVNRVLFPSVLGFDALLQAGADFQQVDRVLEKWGWPMGPAYLMDVVGVDIAVHALAVMSKGFPDRMASSEHSPLQRLFAAKRLGQKNGAGFYRYEADKKGKPKKLVDESVYELLGGGQPIEPHSFSDEEIIARFMVPMCTEMARCLEEGIVSSPSEADMALIYGVGFPPFRGGVFRWLDEIGLDTFCAMAEPLAELGPLYQPTDAMRAMANNSKTYYSAKEI
ncbi:fatty acid oxidation complex subunit alpha FadB [Porticoccus sp. W117]|uniref:fatty acid oxidation complex subunit alpha FadB n=1 Tax=Porticoccus sp. W117 TaxID=3054777 RepID=UPI002593ADDE|nr:fatty acid oxidation complex subunit alpha FadB [Porticoccus sp. W117]MDM3871174.1 fatty acid oxidation complex subunit alpha FadB [Porticoccus sp. W117]